MPHRPLILENLPIIPTLIRLIAKEMHRLELYFPPRALLLGLDMLQTIRLIPAGREDVEGDLPANAVREAEVGELLFEGGDEGGPDVVCRVVGFEGVAFGDGGVAPDGRDVDHAVSAAAIEKPFVSPSYGFLRDVGISRRGSLRSCGGVGEGVGVGVCVKGQVDVPKLNKRPPLDRNVDPRDIHEAEVDQLLVFVLAEPLDEAVAGQRHAESVGCQPVFREAEVEQ